MFIFSPVSSPSEIMDEAVLSPLLQCAYVPMYVMALLFNCLSFIIICLCSIVFKLIHMNHSDVTIIS